MTEYPDICIDAGGIPNPRSKSCFSLFTKFAEKLADEVEKIKHKRPNGERSKMGWFNDYPKAERRGLRVNVLGFG
jgi:hypothetical protein